MKKSQLIGLFRTLSKKEIRDMEKWLDSPFYNQREDVILLFDYLRANLWKEERLDKPMIYHTLFDKKKYDDGKMRYIMSFLLQQIKAYLAYSHWQSKSYEVDLSTIAALRQHDQEQLFEKEITKFSESIKTNQNFTYLRHFYHYQANLEQYKFSLKKSRIKAKNLQKVSDALDTFYISEMLRVNCLMVAHQSVTTQQYQSNMLEEVLKRANAPEFKALPEIAIYLHTYYALTDSHNNDHFLQLKYLITTHWQQFAVSEMRAIYLLAINYCIKKLNRGDRPFIHEALDLYKVGLEKEILLENGELSRFTYNNVLTLSLMVNDFDWARSFLEEYQTYLAKRTRKNVYLYNLTIYHFKKQEYHKVMELLQEVQFRDVLYNLHTRRMLLRSYFEIGAYDLLDSSLDSFLIFIKRRKDLGYHKENFLNLIKFIKKLLSKGHQKSVRQQLLQEIEQTASIADKEWLIEKVRNW